MRRSTPIPAVAVALGLAVLVSGCALFRRPSAPGGEVGLASWYGPEFDGRRTASGRRFAAHALTAAHPTLPLGSRVRVTNLDNGRSVVVTVDDRGPFVDGRVIDVSQAAARRLGMVRSGTARVRVTPLGSGDDTAEAGVRRARAPVR